MEATALTFGCEFECFVPVTTNIEIGGYHRGRQIPGLPEGWNAQSDGSIMATPGYMGVEIVSPILNGLDGLKQVALVCQWLKRVGAKVNNSTGFHVHVGWVGEEQNLNCLGHLVANHEKGLYASTGTHSRENGTYAGSIKRDGNARRRFAGNTNEHVGRMRSLNITNLTGGTKRTVEFRLFAGTTNAAKAIGHIRMCLGLVHKCMELKRKPKWDSSTSGRPDFTCYKRGGLGTTELNRLFHGLGWTKGQARCTYGGEYNDPSLPTMAEMKKVFLKMAAKYDGGNHGETE